MVAICSQLDSNADDFERVRVSVADMSDFCNFDRSKGYSHVKRTIMRLLTRTLQIKHDDGGWYVTHWLQSAKYIPSESVIEYKVDSELKPELLQLKSAYLKTKTLPLMQFNRDYSTRMYFMLRKMVKLREFDYELDFFRDRFQLSKAYGLFSNLKNRILDPAIKEINEKSDINVEHEYIKEGRSYKRVHFVVTMKEKTPEISAPEAAPAHVPETTEIKEKWTEEQQKMYERLTNPKRWNLTERTATKLIEKYDLNYLDENIKYAYNNRKNIDALGGWLITCFKENFAGEERRRQEAAKAAEEREKEKQREAYLIEKNGQIGWDSEDEKTPEISAPEAAERTPEKRTELKEKFAELKSKLGAKK